MFPVVKPRGVIWKAICHHSFRNGRSCERDLADDLRPEMERVAGLLQASNGSSGQRFTGAELLDSLALMRPPDIS